MPQDRVLMVIESAQNKFQTASEGRLMTLDGRYAIA